jgi:DNA invertase Pin-like site-specific DNA recombinase
MKQRRTRARGQREILASLGVPPDRIYLDKGLTGTTRARPGLDQALAAVRAGDTLVVLKLDRLSGTRSG